MLGGRPLSFCPATPERDCGRPPDVHHRLNRQGQPRHQVQAALRYLARDSNQ